MGLSLAFQNADALREIARQQPTANLMSVASATGKDKSNLSKTLNRLEAEGFLTRSPHLKVLPPAHRVIQAADLAEGRATATADGQTGLLHCQIKPDPLNPRADFDSDDARGALDLLRQDILQNGLLQNLVVRAVEGAGDGPCLYRLIAGERRWRAIGEAIREGDWPADRPVPVVVIETDDMGHRLRALAENLQRRNLNPMEEARAFKALIEAGMSTEDVAERVSVSQRQVQMRLQLLELSEEDQERVALPKTDLRHLTVREARAQVQTPKPPKSVAEAAETAAGGRDAPSEPQTAAIRSKAAQEAISEVEAARFRERDIDVGSVDQFSAMMKLRLSLARDRGRAGWHDPAQCSIDELADQLVEHVRKGDPVDIANFAMFVALRGGAMGAKLAIERAAEALTRSV